MLKGKKVKNPAQSELLFCSQAEHVSSCDQNTALLEKLNCTANFFALALCSFDPEPLAGNPSSHIHLFLVHGNMLY